MSNPLTPQDRQSIVFRKLMDRWTERLDTLRKQNDCDQSEALTAATRGRISEVKAMLALDKD